MKGVKPSSRTLNTSLFHTSSRRSWRLFFSGRAWLPRRVRLPARGKAMQARPRPSSSPATRSQPLSCDFPDQARDDVTLDCFQRRKWRGGFCRVRASSPPPAQQGCELAALACLAFLNARQWLGQQLIEARTQDVDQHALTDRFRFHSLMRAAVLVAVVALDDHR